MTIRQTFILSTTQYNPKHQTQTQDNVECMRYQVQVRTDYVLSLQSEQRESKIQPTAFK